MDKRREIEVILETLNITETELANKIGVTYESVNSWNNDRKMMDADSLEKIYSFAFSKNIRFNFLYEQLFKEEYIDSSSVVLFHGAKKEFSMPIDYNRFSKAKNDFGIGFYLGESFEQAASYVGFSNMNKVHSFKLDLKDLNVCKFEVSTEWMIAIAYYRGWLDEHKNSEYVQGIIKKIENSDLIIAPIADNRMFDLIAEFTNGEITDEQTRHALAVTNLGHQYVLKTEKAVQNADFISEMHVCSLEKEECMNRRISLTDAGIKKIKLARIEYKGKGRYIGEILK